MSSARVSLKELSVAHDAMKPPSYIETYENLFSNLRSKPISILELGVHQGGSINVWRDYFPAATVVGLDHNERPPLFPNDPRVHFVKGSQSDTTALASASEHGPFDIVIDDAAHLGRLAKASFNFLFERHLIGGGLYILEDWGAALTMPNWPDGVPHEVVDDARDRFPSYDGGMVGLLKQLIDQMVISRPDFSTRNIQKIHIQPGLSIIEKR